MMIAFDRSKAHKGRGKRGRCDKRKRGKLKGDLGSLSAF